jgi:hypothetical protein
VTGLWLQDIESFEAISQDKHTRELFLRMARLAQSGGLVPFLLELERDRDLDEETKGSLAELASDEGFLHAVEDYVRRTRALH